MASSAKKKTTFAKLNRENKVRERRREKEARREIRKSEAAARRDAPADASPAPEDTPTEEAGGSTGRRPPPESRAFCADPLPPRPVRAPGGPPATRPSAPRRHPNLIGGSMSQPRK